EEQAAVPFDVRLIVGGFDDLDRITVGITVVVEDGKRDDAPGPDGEFVGNGDRWTVLTVGRGGFDEHTAVGGLGSVADPVTELGGFGQIGGRRDLEHRAIDDTHRERCWFGQIGDAKDHEDLTVGVDIVVEDGNERGFTTGDEHVVSYGRRRLLLTPFG